MSKKKKETSSVSYKGKVELGIIKNGKKFKRITTNEGFSTLFTYLCNCLAANLNPNVSVDIVNRPGKLRLLDTSGVSVLSYDINYTDILVVPGSGTNDSSVQFYFLIPGTSIFQKNIKYVQLTSIVNRDIVYAEASFDDIIIVNDINTNLYVAWTLAIGNV